MDSPADKALMNAGDESGACEPPLVQPPGSRVEVDRFSDGLTMRVPAAGLLRGTQGLFVFALLWNSVVGIVSAIMVAAFIKEVANAGLSALFPTAILSLFWIVGIGVLLGSINMGRRRAAIAVSGGCLMLIQTGVFGARQRSWQPGEVAAISAGPSGMEVNDRPVLELQVIDVQGKKFGLLAGRADDELRWIAQELRYVLQIQEQADDTGQVRG
jgi:hypothetical protein